MHPTTENSSQLTEALLLNHKYEEALEGIKPQAEKDEKARAMYMEVMAGWIHNAGIKNIPDSNRKELGEIIKLALNDKHMQTDKKRDLAYLLKEAEFTGEAEKIFLEYAEIPAALFAQPFKGIRYHRVKKQ